MSLSPIRPVVNIGVKIVTVVNGVVTLDATSA